MGVYKSEVFIASRFGEFRALRERLCRQIGQSKHMSPVDLDDGHARHLPPLAECLARVRRAELMILLVGDSYGEKAPGREKSFTHLEYDETMREGSRTRVLVYRLRRGSVSAVEHAVLSSWLEELGEKHTVATLSPADDPEALATEVMTQLHACLYDVRFGEVSDEHDAEPEGLVDSAAEAFDDSDIHSLDAAEALARGDVEVEEVDTIEVGREVRHPAALAALEQRNEAERAVALHELGIAMQHARKALELRPLDGAASLLLARLYVVTGRRDRFHEATSLAERAARVFRQARLPYHAAAAYLWAARAASEREDLAAAHGYVDDAEGLQPSYARARLERARICCREGDTRRAFDCVQEAFQIHTASLWAALRDPHLRSIRSALRRLIQEQELSWRAEVDSLLGVERKLCTISGQTPAPESEPAAVAGLQRLRRRGRDSIARQRELVARVVLLAKQAHRAALVEDRTSAAARLLDQIVTLESEVAAAGQEQQRLAIVLSDARELPSLIHWSSLAPPMAGAGLALFMPWLWLAALVFSLGLGLGVWGLARVYRTRCHARERLSHWEAQHSAAASSLAKLEQQLSAVRAELQELRSRAQQATEDARQALAVFERDSLAMPPRYQPFSSLRGARSGHLVRISSHAAEQFQERYARRIERDDSFLVEDLDAKFSLYRVVSVAREVIQLSRRLAYEPASTSSALVN
ncbi:MAG: hypothetical protein RL685_3307 [Pseudomonadota bacterium]